MVAISSKKIVPWSATSKSPFFEATALVNAPLTCPKSCDSSRSTGIEPVFTGTKALSARGQSLCAGEYRLYSRGSTRVAAFRTRQGGVHERCGFEKGAFRGGRPGHDFL